MRAIEIGYILQKYLEETTRPVINIKNYTMSFYCSGFDLEISLNMN